MPEVNPEILQWARKTAALSLDEAAQKIGLGDAGGVSGPDRLAALEAGERKPSRPLLKRMAKHYRRPLVAFYLSRRPRRGNRGQDFRTLGEDHSETADALLDALIRDVLARQSLVRSLLVDEEEAQPTPLVGSKTMSAGVLAVVEAIRQAVPITLPEFRACRDANAAFSALRSAAESASVFVLLIGDLGSYHTALDVETFRGFSLADPIAPFVVINDRDSRAAWSFTLVHELAHLCLGQTGVSGLHGRRRIEVFCNDVASEFLLPAAEIERLQLPRRQDVATLASVVSDFAAELNVSSSMVAYKLRSAERISSQTCRRLLAAYRARWHEHRDLMRERRSRSEGGPNFYVVRAHRIGGALTGLVDRMLKAGALPTVKASQVLGVKPKQVQHLLELSAHGAGAE